MAENTEGYCSLCPSLFVNPSGPLLSPLVVEFKHAASNTSSIALYFTLVTSPGNKGSIVHAYVVEWSTSDTFQSGMVTNALLSTDFT